jgi:hypothetical protein
LWRIGEPDTSRYGSKGGEDKARRIGTARSHIKKKSAGIGAGNVRAMFGCGPAVSSLDVGSGNLGAMLAGDVERANPPRLKQGATRVPVQ